MHLDVELLYVLFGYDIACKFRLCIDLVVICDNFGVLCTVVTNDKYIESCPCKNKERRAMVYL